MSTITELTVQATNEGTYIVTGTYKDEAGDAVTPQTMTWSLTDENGKVINSRDATSITPSTSNSVVLSGDDINKDKGGIHRVFIFDGTYNSVTYGNGLVLRGQASFDIGPWVVKQ